MPCVISHVTEDSVVCLADTAVGVCGERWKEGQTHEGCRKVHFLTYSGYIVQELAEADYLIVMGGNDVSKPAIPV